MANNTKPVGVAYEDPLLDGAVIGKSGGTAGFFGKTPTTQIGALNTIDISSFTTSSISYLSTSQISALQTDVNGIIVGLKQLGLMAS